MGHGVSPQGAPEPITIGSASGQELLALRVDGEHGALRVHGLTEILLTPGAASVLSRWLNEWNNARPVPVLWSIRGIEEECTIARRTVDQWRAHEQFPEPVPVVGGGLVWEASKVRAWVRQFRPGRA